MKYYIAFLSLLIIQFNLYSENDALGSFTFINAIDSKDPTFVLINGNSYKIPGYMPGQMTISAQLYSGITNFQVNNNAIGSTSISLKVGPKTPIILVAFVEKSQKENGEEVEKIVLKELQSMNSKNYITSAIYVTSSDEPLVLEVNSENKMLPPMTKKAISDQASLNLRVNNRPSRTINAALDRVGHYVVVAFDKNDGSIGLSFFQDEPDSRGN
jgi:hypothetical protein